MQGLRVCILFTHPNAKKRYVNKQIKYIETLAGNYIAKYKQVYWHKAHTDACLRERERRIM